MSETRKGETMDEQTKETLIQAIKADAPNEASLSSFEEMLKSGKLIIM